LLIERCFTWLNRKRRWANDVGAADESASGWFDNVRVKLMSRRGAAAKTACQPRPLRRIVKRC
jgi:hypothetical protein